MYQNLLAARVKIAQHLLIGVLIAGGWASSSVLADPTQANDNMRKALTSGELHFAERGDYAVRIPVDGWSALPAGTLDNEAEIEIIGPNEDYALTYRYEENDWTIENVNRSRRYLLSENNEISEDKEWRELDPKTLKVIAYARYAAPNEDVGTIYYNVKTIEVGEDIVHYIVVTDSASPPGTDVAMIKALSAVADDERPKPAGRGGKFKGVR